MNKTSLYILICLILVATNACHNPQPNRARSEPDELSLHLKVLREYTVPYTGNIRYEGSTDTLMEKRFDIGLSIKNDSHHPVAIWLMSCSWWDRNIMINNPYFNYHSEGCDKNIPLPHSIGSHDSLYLTGTLIRDLGVENACTDCNTGMVETTKLGLVYIDTIMSPTQRQYTSIIEDKSKWDRIIWSNPLYLNKR